MRASLTISLLMALLITGCYSAVPVPPPTALSMPARRSQGTVTVAADPYGDIARQKAVFHQNFRDERVIAIQVFVRNDGASPVLVRLPGITLKPPLGEELFSVQPEAALDLSQAGGALGGDPFSLLVGLVVIMPLEVAAGIHAGQQLRDYHQKELAEVTLPTGAEAHGFVYFRPTKGTPAFDEAALNVRVVDLAALRTNVLSLPLTGLNFRGWKD